MTKDEARAIYLYAVANRDPLDFLDDMRDREGTSDVAVAWLYAMVAPENQIGRKKTDTKLNELLEPMIRQELVNRGIWSTWEALIA